MFESTLEAQALGEGDRRLGTLSAAVLAHLGVVLAIVAVTAVIVPPIRGPEPPVDPFPVISMIPLERSPERPPGVPAPPKGTEAAKPGKAAVPPPVVPDVPPAATPDDLPAAESDTPNAAGPDGPGEGALGDLNGSPTGIPGGLGDGADGPGVETGGDPLEVTGDMTRPVRLVRVEPIYPEVPRRAGLGGRVTVRAVIAEDGSVESVEVFASTNPLFNDAAVDAVRKWRYRPALLNGRPVRVYLSVVVDFLVR